MNLKSKTFIGGFNRFRLMLTLGLAVLLPAAALIYLNFSELRTFERDKVLEAAIHRDFQEVLAITEKNIDKKAYAMIEEARDAFPPPDTDEQQKEKQLDLLLSKSPWMAHAFLFDEKGLVMRSRPEQMSDKSISEEHDRLAENFRGWFGLEGKSLVAGLHKKSRPVSFSFDHTKRGGNYAYLETAWFVLPQLANDRIVLGGVSFEPCYLNGTLLQQALDEQVNQKFTDQGGNPLAMSVYPADTELGRDMKPLAISVRSEEHTSELQSPDHLVCRLLLEKKKTNNRH